MNAAVKIAVGNTVKLRSRRRYRVEPMTVLVSIDDSG